MLSLMPVVSILCVELLPGDGGGVLPTASGPADCCASTDTWRASGEGRGVEGEFELSVWERLTRFVGRLAASGLLAEASEARE